MNKKSQGSRKAPRPSRKNVVITPHKGGRVARFECRLTLAENKIITRLVEASGLSKSDWLMALAKPNKARTRQKLEGVPRFCGLRNPL